MNAIEAVVRCFARLDPIDIMYTSIGFLEAFEEAQAGLVDLDRNSSAAAMVVLAIALSDSVLSRAPLPLPLLSRGAA